MRKIKIMWLVNDFYINNFKPVYDRIKNSKNFEVIVVATNYYLNNEVKNQSSEILKNLKLSQIDAINSYESESSTLIDLKEIAPDYIFINSPYEMYLPKEYGFEYLSSFSRLCSISYGSKLVKEEGIYENTFEKNSFFKYGWKMFIENSEVIEGVDEALINFFDVIGNVKLEFYKKEITRNSNKKNFIVTWKPRWTLDDSNFFENVEEFYEFFKNKKDIKLIICIHPLFFSKLKAKDTDLKYTKILNKFKKMSNVKFIDDGDFLRPVLNSDLFIGEHSSTMAEFAATAKPIIFLKTKIKLNGFGQRIARSSYVAKNSIEVFEYIEKIKRGEDALKSLRIENSKNYFPKIDGFEPSQNLLIKIEEDFKKTFVIFERYKKQNEIIRQRENEIEKLVKNEKNSKEQEYSLKGFLNCFYSLIKKGRG